jgi:hypothetical protein
MQCCRRRAIVVVPVAAAVISSVCNAAPSLNTAKIERSRSVCGLSSAPAAQRLPHRKEEPRPAIRLLGWQHGASSRGQLADSGLAWDVLGWAATGVARVATVSEDLKVSAAAARQVAVAFVQRPQVATLCLGAQIQYVA